jgi:undecaprenyl diphosphate synthase
MSTGEVTNRVPCHVAIIMDGNGRWARQRGEDRIFGHMNGVKAVRQSVEAAIEAGVEGLTLYAFSTENWNRPQEEIAALMDLLVQTLVREVDELAEQGVRLRTIGNLDALPDACRAELLAAEERTAHLDGLQLILALSYSSKWELTEAVKSIVRSGISHDEVTDELIATHLSTAGLPDPELMIRTGGEHRISNFMLWQLAYAEFYFTPVLWPDFDKANFFEAIDEYKNRERRFGGLIES